MWKKFEYVFSCGRKVTKRKSVLKCCEDTKRWNPRRKQITSNCQNIDAESSSRATTHVQVIPISCRSFLSIVRNFGKDTRARSFSIPLLQKKQKCRCHGAPVHEWLAFLAWFWQRASLSSPGTTTCSKLTYSDDTRQDM